MAKVNFPYLVGVDWFQVFGFIENPIAPTDIDGVTIKVSEFPTPQFMKRATVFLNRNGFNIEAAELLFEPRLSSLKANSAMFRLKNPVLYADGWFSVCMSCFRVLGFSAKSISRIDLYYDCNRFKGGLLPAKLIQGFVSGKYLKIGISRGYLAFNSWGYSIPINTRSPTVELKKGTPNINAVTFGQKGYIQTQIYNKSLELRSKGNKPYIVDCWQRVGLDIDNVWRTEIRIQGSGKDLKLLDTGDMFSLGLFEVSNAERIYELFLTYADRHVRFVRADYHKKRQQMRHLDLFCYSQDIQRTIKPKIARNPGGTLQTAKVVRNYIEAIAERYENNTLVSEYVDSAQVLRRANVILSKTVGGLLCCDPRKSKINVIDMLDEEIKRINMSMKNPRLFASIDTHLVSKGEK